MSLDCFSDLDQVPELLQEIHPGLFILPTGILILPNPVPRMQEPVFVYPVTTEIVPLVVGQTDCLLPEPILHAPAISGDFPLRNSPR